MKHSLISIILVTFAVAPCAAQWKTAVYDDQILAFGVHDTTLFISAPPFPSSPGSVLRFVPNAAPADHWVEADSGIDFTQGNVTSFASLGRYFFAGITHSDGSNGPVFSSSNNGSMWTHGTTAGPIFTAGAYLFSTYTGPSEIVRSGDSGNKWDVMKELAVSSFAAIGTWVFVNTGSALWQSEDTGNHWSELSPQFVGAMTVMDSIIFITGATNGSVIESTDSGSQWNQVAVDSGTTPLHVNALATDGKNLFAGTTKGVYLSRDAGKTWVPKNEGLTYLNVDVLGVCDTLLFVNTPASSIHYTAMRSIPEMIADTGTASVVQALQPGDSIEVYPNPASRMVTIMSSEPILGIQVTNILGVTVLPSSFPLPEGEGMSLNFSNVPPGTYFVAIRTEKGTILKKVTIVR